MGRKKDLITINVTQEHLDYREVNKRYDPIALAISEQYFIECEVSSFFIEFPNGLWIRWPLWFSGFLDNDQLYRARPFSLELDLLSIDRIVKMKRTYDFYP